MVVRHILLLVNVVLLATLTNARPKCTPNILLSSCSPQSVSVSANKIENVVGLGTTKCTLTLLKDGLEHCTIGQTGSFVQNVLGAFDSTFVTIDSPEQALDLFVDDGEAYDFAKPVEYALHRKLLCGDYIWQTDIMQAFSGHTKCHFPVARYGWFPGNQSRIGFKRATTFLGKSKTSAEITLTLQTKRDTWKMLWFAIGMAMLFLAPYILRWKPGMLLSGSIVCSTFFIAIALIFLYKLLPGGRAKTIMTAFLLSVGYNFTAMSSWLTEALVGSGYKEYVVIMIGVISLVGGTAGFAYSYVYLTHLSDESLNVVVWATQFLGVILVINSTNSIVLAAFALSFIFLPSILRFLNSVRVGTLKFYRWMCPKDLTNGTLGAPKYITRKEYNQEARDYTRKKLEELYSNTNKYPEIATGCSPAALGKLFKGRHPLQSPAPKSELSDTLERPCSGMCEGKCGSVPCRAGMQQPRVLSNQDRMDLFGDVRHEDEDCQCAACSGGSPYRFRYGDGPDMRNIPPPTAPPLEVLVGAPLEVLVGAPNAKKRGGWDTPDGRLQVLEGAPNAKKRGGWDTPDGRLPSNGKKRRN